MGIPPSGQAQSRGPSHAANRLSASPHAPAEAENRKGDAAMRSRNTIKRDMKRDPDERPGEVSRPGMVWIPGGTFRMGSEDFYPEERPVHEVAVDGFWMDRDTVTNLQFKRFVEATSYVTLAERAP